MLEFKANEKQKGELDALAYWIADKKYIRERFGDNEPELQTCHKTIMLIFDVLDELKVPFWVQNSVICFAEDWRRYINYGEQGRWKYLKEKRNITYEI